VSDRVCALCMSKSPIVYMTTLKTSY